jgi:hypothetical protein
MPLLPAVGLARWLAQAPGPRRVLQPIARGWLAALIAVEVEPALQLGDPALQASINSFSAAFSVSSLSMSAFQDIFGFARRIGPIRRLTLVA